MNDRDSIIRKLNSLRDMANHPSTEPALVETAMRKFNKLMEEYNLTLTDLEVRQSTIDSASRNAKGGNTTQTRSPMGWTVIDIATLTDTVLVAHSGMNGWLFAGLPSDVQYATFLYDLISNSMDQAAVGYKATRDYHNRINEGMKAAEAVHHFKHGFRIAVCKSLAAMIEEKNGKGQALVILKREIILAQMNGAQEATASNSKALSLNTALSDITKMGFKEGEKVKLRKEMGNNEKQEVKGYLA